MGDTSISWTDKTWNPIRGCRRTAPEGSKQSGCGDPTGGGCYAERQAARFCGPGQAYEGLITLTANGPRWSGKTKFVGEHLIDPMRWRKPQRIFVDSMSDLFYEGFTDEQIAAVFGVMVLAAQHTYQILTKRPERMREWFKRWSVEACLDVLVRLQLPNGQSVPGPQKWNRPPRKDWCDTEAWPIPWIWLGVSVENQAAADERIPELLKTPAAVRFLSCEPLIAAVDLAHVRHKLGESSFEIGSVLEGDDGFGLNAERNAIDWVIIGCESGPGARPCAVDWVRSLRDQCISAGVSLFVKQAEESADCGYDQLLHPEDDDSIAFGDGSRLKARRTGGHHIIELPYLDGIQHASFPEVP